MPKEQPRLKKLLYEMYQHIDTEIKRLNDLLVIDRNVDLKVVHTKIQCLEQERSDLEKIIGTCIARNKF